MEARILGFVDDAHSAAAEFFQDEVVRDLLAEHVNANLTFGALSSQCAVPEFGSV